MTTNVFDYILSDNTKWSDLVKFLAKFISGGCGNTLLSELRRNERIDYYRAFLAEIYTNKHYNLGLNK